MSEPIVRKRYRPTMHQTARLMFVEGERVEIADIPRVWRDPCPRCGVRADIGCEHGWRP